MAVLAELGRFIRRNEAPIDPIREDFETRFRRVRGNSVGAEFSLFTDRDGKAFEKPPIKQITDFVKKHVGSGNFDRRVSSLFRFAQLPTKLTAAWQFKHQEETASSQTKLTAILPIWGDRTNLEIDYFLIGGNPRNPLVVDMRVRHEAVEPRYFGW